MNKTTKWSQEFGGMEITMKFLSILIENNFSRETATNPK